MNLKQLTPSQSKAFHRLCRKLRWSHSMQVAHLHDCSVIHGTHRTQDLIPAFLDCLSVVDPMAHAQIVSGPFGAIPAYVQDEGDSSEWWDSEDAHYLLESLFDALNESAAEGWYFGAHPGDGSDFGFWKEDSE